MIRDLDEALIAYREACVARVDAHVAAWRLRVTTDLYASRKERPLTHAERERVWAANDMVGELREAEYHRADERNNALALAPSATFPAALKTWLRHHGRVPLKTLLP